MDEEEIDIFIKRLAKVLEKAKSEDLKGAECRLLWPAPTAPGAPAATARKNHRFQPAQRGRPQTRFRPSFKYRIKP